MKREFKVIVVSVLVILAVMGLVVYVAFGQVNSNNYLPIVLKQNTPTPTATPTPTPTSTPVSFTHKIVFDVSNCSTYTLSGQETGSQTIQYTVTSNNSLINTVVLSFGLWQDGTYYGYSSTQLHPSPAQPDNTSSYTTITFTWVNSVSGHNQYIYFKLGGGPVNQCAH